MKNRLNFFEQIGVFAYCGAGKTGGQGYRRAIVLLVFITMYSLFILSLTIKIRMDTKIDFVSSMIVMLVIIFGSDYLCNYYFIKSERCLKIIQAHERLSARKRYWYGAIIVGYYLFSTLFILFELGVLASNSDKY